ncbi:MAG: tetratricopeptide repeat protein [Pseudomonadota bacterium]|nr:tetratricopeptide repeat protein [Pseudomonadota bacterium]
MGLRQNTFCAAAAVAALAGFATAQQAQDSGVMIGDELPMMTACYRSAVDGAVGEDGLEPCNRSLSGEPLSDRKRAIVHANRGVVQFNSGDYAAAIEDFTAALDLGINVRARILVNRGLCYEALRYDALARADYQAALAFNPDNAAAKRRLEELEKPAFERVGVPRRITADAGFADIEGS